MTQITINIEDASIRPSLMKILKSIKGISVQPTKRPRKCGLELALEDVRAGRVEHYANAEEMFKSLGI